VRVQDGLLRPAGSEFDDLLHLVLQAAQQLAHGCCGQSRYVVKRGHVGAGRGVYCGGIDKVGLAPIHLLLLEVALLRVEFLLELLLFLVELHVVFVLGVAHVLGLECIWERVFTLLELLGEFLEDISAPLDLLLGEVLLLHLLHDEGAAHVQVVVYEVFDQALHLGVFLQLVIVALEVLVETVHERDPQGFAAGD